MKAFETISLSIENRIATVWLNRPEVQNAINLEMATELTKCYNFLEKSKDVRIILLRGKGVSFCSGADLKWMKNSGTLPFRRNMELSKIMSKCYYAIYNSSKPTMAIVHGGVYGGANGFVSACDIAIAAGNASFALSEVRVGLAPSTIMPYILTRLNEHNAKWLMISGKKIDAVEAFKVGLVDFYFNEMNLEENLKTMLKDIFKGSPKAISESKRLLNEVIHEPIDKKVRNATIRSIAKMKKSDEGQEGMSSFIEKRKPYWVFGE